MKPVFYNISVVWMFIYLLIGQGLLTGFVICLGRDGQIAMEAAYARRCNPDSRATSQTVPHTSLFDETSNNNHCGPCVDIPLSISSLDSYMIPARNRALPLKAPALTAFSFSSPPVVALAPAVLPPPSPSFINPTLASLRTVTLLI